MVSFFPLVEVLSLVEGVVVGDKEALGFSPEAPEEDVVLQPTNVNRASLPKIVNLFFIFLSFIKNPYTCNKPA